MLFFTIGLLLGSWIFQQSSELPSQWYGLPIGLLLLANFRWQLPAIINGFLLGWAWTLLYATWHMPQPIPDLQIRQTYVTQGVVDSLPEQGKDRTRFYFRVKQLTLDGKKLSGDWRLRVSWRQAARLRVGQQWQLALRIKPVRSYQNPGGWDYAGWLYRQGVRYSAYVRKSPDNQPQGESRCCWLDALRETIYGTVQALDMSATSRGILLALTIGDRSGLSSATKKLFAHTGTSHLMAISGLHIGLIAGLCAWITSFVWRRIPVFCRRYPAILAGVVAGLITGTIYAALSGMGLPTQRALLMLFVFGFALLSRRKVEPIRVLAMAAVLVVLWQPDAVIQAGFWLSFVAVASIFMLLPQLKGKHWLLQAVLLQLGISLALLPVLWVFGMPGSLLAPAINLLMVPLFGLLIVPVALFGVLNVFWLPLAGDGLILLGYLLDGLVNLLQLIVAHNTMMPIIPWAWWLWGLMIIPVVLVLSPIKWHWRVSSLLGFILLWPLASLAKPSVAYGDYHVSVLDVGQGLSVVVRTQNHALLYDTGAAYASGFNLADAVVLPYLRHQGIQHVDTLLLSHGDNDHAGAAQQVLQAMPVDQVLSGEPHRLAVPSETCRIGQAWQWDGVHFRILHPQHVGSNSNNQSCVLLVSNAVGNSLLPGDIEARVEQRLLGQLKPFAPFGLVVVPHHGSKSSSSQAFIQAVQARHVVYSSGAYNRYGFPKNTVVQRWQAAGARNWQTDQSGALQFDFVQRSNRAVFPDEYIKQGRRYWHWAH
jgi:competence protein ComEC